MSIKTTNYSNIVVVSNEEKATFDVCPSSLKASGRFRKETIGDAFQVISAASQDFIDPAFIQRMSFSDFVKVAQELGFKV